MERRAAYVYCPEIEQFNYGPEHPMKPKKIAMTHDILAQSEVLNHFDLYKGYIPSSEEIQNFHSKEYVEFMRDYFQKREESQRDERFGIGYSSDTPAFPGFFDFSRLTCGASMLSAELLVQGRNDVVVN